MAWFSRNAESAPSDEDLIRLRDGVMFLVKWLAQYQTGASRIRANELAGRLDFRYSTVRCLR